MHITRIADRHLPTHTRCAIGRYRHQVFIQALQWDLPTQGGQEHDEFDHHAAVHLLAQVPGQALIGYARLLPTTGSYLLGTHFPHLIEGGHAPCDPAIWELSRYTACDVMRPSAAACAATQTRVGKQLLLEAVRYVAQQGGEQIVFCTTLAVERLAHRWGVHIERMGAARHDGREWLVAARIYCNERTRGALSPAPRWPAPRPGALHPAAHRPAPTHAAELALA